MATNAAVSKIHIDSKWINEQHACEWLGVSRQFLNKYAKEFGIPFSYLKGSRGKMYDRKAIENLLDTNAVENYITEKYLS